MQFAGSCSHPRVVDGREPYPPELLETYNVPALNPMMTGADVSGDLERASVRRRPLILVEPVPWRRCSCSSCSVGAPCLNLAGA